MLQNERVTGYLDVKVSLRSRRGFRPWKAWKKQWCEIQRLDSIENGVEIKLKTSEEGSLLNSIVVPRSSTVCRTESRTKRYAFGIFNLRNNKKPILFMSGSSECDAQIWMYSIRKMLSVASYIPVGESSFHVSLVDNVHSRAAGLLGMFGVLTTNEQEIVISDPCTGQAKVTWKWYMFHQFHLQVSTKGDHEKSVIVMHTSSDFPVAGPGQLHLYCLRGVGLLRLLSTRGRPHHLYGPKRLSRSEGDLRTCFHFIETASNSPVCPRSQTGSDDSGVRVSIGGSGEEAEIGVMDEHISEFNVTGLTPGGSETEDSLQDLVEEEGQIKPTSLPRNESGISMASGIYEEIDENTVRVTKPEPLNHVYENPLELILESKRCFAPPPLPPRRVGSPSRSAILSTKFPYVYVKQRCNTLPAKDLSKISKMFTTESEYVVMSPIKKNIEGSDTMDENVLDDFYMPMSPVNHGEDKLGYCEQ